jgi:peptide/nickel transport system substrate-binding protein
MSRWIPTEYYAGLLAESWEIPDLQTWIIHIRPGVHWQDKEPVNGREFVADDVVFHYDRHLALGQGFTEPSPFATARLGQVLEKVTALDKYTIEAKFKKPGLANFVEFSELGDVNCFEAPEVVRQYGDTGDWKNAVGTGPWILTDYVSETSITLTRNPNYWGHDERYPENQLPYIDTYRMLNIQDVATKLSALRTGQIDFTSHLSFTEALNIAKTNPELEQYTLPTVMAAGVDLRVDTAPFTDIRVRKALQMSIDRKTIAESYYAGTVDGTPCGPVNPSYKEYAFLYEDWPQELKDEYAYNPEGARQLLADAGYPDGFETNILASATEQIELLEIVKAYFLDIGVDMEILAQDPSAWRAMSESGLYDQMLWNRNTGSIAEPGTIVIMAQSTSAFNFSFTNDPAFDAICEKINAAPDLDAYKQACVEGDRYRIEQHWSITIMSWNEFTVMQPQLKGYSGEWWHAYLVPRLWLAQD